MNHVLAILPLTAFFANMILAIYILYKNPRGKLNRIYSLFALSVTIWAIGTFLTYTAPTPEMAMLYNKLASIGTLILPVFLLHFFLVFTKNKLISRKGAFIPLYLPAVFLIFINLTTNLIHKSVELFYWGYNYIPGPLYTLDALYIIGYFIVGLLFCYRFYSKATKKEKMQAKLLLIAICIPLVGGIATEAIPLLIGYEMFPLSTLLITISALIIAYAMLKYGLMAPVSLSVRNKMIALLLIISIIPISVTGFLFIETAQSDLKEQIGDYLEIAVWSRTRHIETIITDYKYITESASKSPIYMDVLKDPDDPLLRQKATGMILGILKTRPEILRIDILDKNGVIIVSSDASVLGTDESEIFSVLETEGFFIKDAHVSKRSGVPCIDYNSPIFSDDRQMIGGIIIGLDMNSLYEVTTDKTGLGETGEIYIVNKDGYMISPSRFEGDTFLKQKVDTENYRNCIVMHEHGTMHNPQEAVGISKDYRNTDTLGTHAYIPRMEWCVLGEIDVREAFMPYSNLQNNLILISVIFAVLSLTLSVLVSRSITDPLIRLKRAASEIGKGRLDTKIEVESKDEIGELASTFKQMTKDLKISQEQIKEHTKELEQKVKERTTELDQKICELTNTKTAVLNMMEDMDEANNRLVRAQEELKDSLAELKEMDVKKDEFISIAAHELKTPLTSIHGFSQLLQNKQVVENPDKRNKYLKIMDHETKRLGKLVGDILNLSRIDLGSMNLSYDKVNLNELMDSVMREMSIQIKAKRLKSESYIESKLPIITTDKEKLTEILINLINNSVKYTIKGKIILKATKEGKNIHVIVNDTGIGIAKENQENIFDRFYQVDSSYTRKAGGTGLGLALCKEFIEILGGRIWVESELNKGSRFHFTLPIKSSQKTHLRKEEKKAKDILRKSEETRKKIRATGFGVIGNNNQ